MKVFFPLLIFSFSAATSFAQSFRFIDGLTVAQPAYYRNVADSTGDEFILHCTNVSNATKSAKVRMTVLSTPSGCSNNVFFCDPIACYPPSVHISVAAFDIGAGDTVTAALVPHIDPGFCCGDYSVSYCLFDVANESDSVNVKVYYNVNGNHCTDGIGELTESYSLCDAYPNPATDELFIPYRLENGTDGMGLVLLNMSGEQVQEYVLKGYTGELKIDATFLPQGIYFYALRNQNNISGFKKLLIIK
jgi:hypothetical protein